MLEAAAVGMQSADGGLVVACRFESMWMEEDLGVVVYEGTREGVTQDQEMNWRYGSTLIVRRAKRKARVESE